MVAEVTLHHPKKGVNYHAHNDPELDQVQVASHNLLLAAPKGHPLTKLKSLRLRDLADTAFVWFPRRLSPAFYDHLMKVCFRGGLKTPHIVQEALDPATILSLVTDFSESRNQSGFIRVYEREFWRVSANAGQ
jgi:DNA-binding transcriptional LysR family regulator